MTKTATRPTLADLDIPPVSAEYGTPPLPLLPESLRPLAKAVRAAADRIPAATAARKAAERLVKTADGDYDAALVAAEREGEPLDTVADFRPQRHADLARFTKFEKVAKDSARTRWTEFIRAVCAERDEVLALVQPLVDEAQADTVAAAAEFERSRRVLDQATGLSQWVHGLQPQGNVLPVSTLQGPRQEGDPEVAWRDRTGRIHRLPGRTVVTAIGVYSRGADALAARLARSAARDARVRGDVEAQRKPVPSGVISDAG